MIKSYSYLYNGFAYQLCYDRQHNNTTRDLRIGTQKDIELDAEIITKLARVGGPYYADKRGEILNIKERVQSLYCWELGI